jgi:hypothetical protein
MSEPEESEIEAAEDAPRKGKAGLREITQKPGFRKFGMGVLFIALVMYGLALYWSQEPKPFDVVEEAAHAAHVENPKEMPLGYTYSTTLIEISHTLLHKPGGFLSNDVFPPSVFLDNIPNWELGALIALRDATTQLRNNIARSQTQSQEDPDLAKGEPFFYFDYRSWQLPSSESEYEKGIESLEAYRERLRKRGANFYARADNLRQYLEVLEKRLGDYSNRLSASTADRVNDETEERHADMERTPWLKLDDRFFEARGYTWAAMLVLKSIEWDFRDILGNKTAQVSLQHIVRELENCQESYLSPVILNGSGFGLFANYSLTLANYIARANAATIDLRSLLERG